MFYKVKVQIQSFKIRQNWIEMEFFMLNELNNKW